MDVLSKQFLNQLQLTRLWCQSRVNISDPRNCLRSSDLRPELETFRGAAGSVEVRRRLGVYRDDDVWIHPELVEQVIRQRQLFFSVSNGSVSAECCDRYSGRLLIAAQDYSNHNGLTSDLTSGFFDLNDVPPWDTWITLIQGERQGMSLSIWESDWPPTLHSALGYVHLMSGILVSWVPSQFEAMVDEAMKCEVIGMLAWADDLPQENAACLNFRRVLPRWFQNLMNRK